MTESAATAALPDDRRREPRQTLTDVTVAIEGRAYPVRDWSESGFLAEGYEGGLGVGDRTDIDMSAPSSDGAIDVACQAIVVRVDGEARTLAAAFVRLDRETRVALQEHFQKIDATERGGNRDRPESRD
ncbi:MAG: PilZ domain-containing protein [Alphaproteobacteria bacterium]|nr:PilZ domain-containing protein [Alphaproteobacteria bacterium]